MREMSASRKSVLLIFLVLILDQLSKYFVLNYVGMTDVYSCGLFNIVHVENTGVVFGILRTAHKFVLLALSLTVLGIFVLWIKNTKFWLAEGLIIGGAIGNVSDRIVHGAVIDFLDFYVGPHHWPAFNIADSAVVLGVALLLLRREEK